MHSDWRNHIEQAGARITDDIAQDFGAPETEARAVLSGDAVAELSYFGILTVAGEDAESFLQSQTGNDITAVDASHSQLSSYSSAKGRMYAIFRVFQRDGAYCLRLPRAVIPALRDRLKLFVLMSKVELGDARDELAGLGVTGEAAIDQLQQTAGRLPEQVGEATAPAGLTIIRVPDCHERPRYEVWGRPAELIPVWEALAPMARPAGSDAWALSEIEAGLPAVFSETYEQFVPQMANLDHLAAINFQKGCYPGQEVVARMHYRGGIKRRMYRFHSAAETPPRPGERVVRVRDGAAKEAGEIVDARRHPDGGCRGLAVLQIDAAESDALYLVDTEGPALTLMALPYSLEAAPA